jgi:hypothetical protein
MPTGFKHTEETKAKLRQIRLGTKMSPEAIEKMRQTKIGGQAYRYGKPSLSFGKSPKMTVAEGGQKGIDELRKLLK